MCGICGKLTFNDEVVDRALISKMCRAIIHRGPDDEGIYTAPGIGLGQRRLAIIDLNSRAVAPLANEDETIWVTFNGEIYNFPELRADLISRGHTFRTNTDTEVIVHLYEDYGIECLARMRGMFAFALWDSRKRLLFAARDRFGKKPFYYTKTPKSFIFGSEIKAITADPSVSKAPNFKAIDAYLTYQYVPSPLTAFEGISKLPPGHYLTCTEDGNLEVSRYWAPHRSEDLTLSEGEIQSELLRLLRESVNLRMISDVPLGAFLSGGIDSAAIVALMATESSRPVKTFSIGFEEESHNELPFARQVAEQYKTDHHEFIVKPNAAEVLENLVWHYNEPFADSSALPTYYLCKLARQHVTVALSGDGGDENFSGYEKYGNVAQWNMADAVPFGIRNRICAPVSNLLASLPHSNLGARCSRGFYMLGNRLPERYLLNMALLKPQERKASYTAHFRSLIEMEQSLDPLTQMPWDEDMDEQEWMMRHDQQFYLPDCLMVKTDIASMANSLEVRCPLLDHKLAEFSANIPSFLKRHGSVGKVVFKKALRDLLPASIINRRKSGFNVPLGKWFGGGMSDLLREQLLGPRAVKRGLLDQSFVRSILNQHIAGVRDWSNRLWAFLMLELWFQQFID